MRFNDTRWPTRMYYLVSTRFQIRFKFGFKYSSNPMQVLPFSHLLRQAGNTVGLFDNPCPQGWSAEREGYSSIMVPTVKGCSERRKGVMLKGLCSKRSPLLNGISYRPMGSWEICRIIGSSKRKVCYHSHGIVYPAAEYCTIQSARSSHASSEV